MAEVLVFFTAMEITYWALIPVAVAQVVVGGLHYGVSKLVRSSQSQSAKIVKEGLSFSISISLAYAGGLFRMIVIRVRNLLAGANFIPAIINSFRSNEDQWLASCNSYPLPEDLVIDQILSRLPVKSLMRFKSVCKRWHSLPTDPSFIASHLKHINTPNRLASWNGNDNGLIVSHDGFHVFTVCRDIANFQPVDLKFGFDRKADLVLGPCDGIFCLYWRPIEFGYVPLPCVERLPAIVLWNPATRAFSILPMSKFDFPPYKKVSDCIVGFGFDLKCKSIKVVKVVSFCCDEDTPDDYVNCAEVYDLCSGSWRELHVDHTPQKVFVSDDQTNSMYNSNDGVFHWHSCLRRRFNVDEELFSAELVLSFDMSRELFHVTLMPEKYNIFYRSLNYTWRECYFSLLRDSPAVNLSLFREGSLFEEGHSTVELWVMKDLDRIVEAGVSFSSYSWSHELTVELSNSAPCVLMGFWNKNELLMLKRDRLSGTPFLYDNVTKQARDFQLSGEPNFLYRESLVSVTGGCGNGQFTFI